MTGEYDDIMHLLRHVSNTRPQMEITNRAAQFSPFAALAGHGDAIEETARITEKQIELDEYMKRALNDKLQILNERILERPEIRITHFQADETKDGGAYIDTKGIIKKIDEYERIILMEDGTVIPIHGIIDIAGEGI